MGHKCYYLLIIVLWVGKFIFYEINLNQNLISFSILNTFDSFSVFDVNGANNFSLECPYQYEHKQLMDTLLFKWNYSVLFLEDNIFSRNLHFDLKIKMLYSDIGNI